MVIEFYSPDRENGWLANFSKHPIVVDGIEYSTVEHYYQSQKFNDAKYRDIVAFQATPEQAKLTSKSMNEYRRPDWGLIKIDVMYRAIKAKFEQHKDLRERLIITGNEEIIENAPNDLFWGINAFGEGENQMGLLLMKLRSEIINTST